MTQFFGKYRGKVKNNVDPLQLGRLQVEVPAVQGNSSNNWATPCVPYAGSGVGFFFIPPVGANIWVEYEGGNTDNPIWAGCFWGSQGDAPAQPAIPGTKMIKTDNATITIHDPPNPPGFTIETVTPPVKISITSSEIEITNGVAGFKMSGAQVSINNGALEVI